MALILAAGRSKENTLEQQQEAMEVATLNAA